MCQNVLEMRNCAQSQTLLSSSSFFRWAEVKTFFLLFLSLENSVTENAHKSFSTFMLIKRNGKAHLRRQRITWNCNCYEFALIKLMWLYNQISWSRAWCKYHWKIFHNIRTKSIRNLTSAQALKARMVSGFANYHANEIYAYSPS